MVIHYHFALFPKISEKQNVNGRETATSFAHTIIQINSFSLRQMISMYFNLVTLIVNFCDHLCSDVDTQFCINISIAVLFSGDDFGILQCITTQCMDY